MSNIALYVQNPEDPNDWALIATNEEARRAACNADRVLRFMQSMDQKWTGMIFDGGGAKMMLAESFDYIVDTTTPRLHRIECFEVAQ